jgi:hypothetical protein
MLSYLQGQVDNYYLVDNARIDDYIIRFCH